ncbi:MAG TPA: efflux RND transporter periplasmic adaptor subunit, partial [Patescibacteria group bacterium]|nr:efflux RND transporter periplasmic adaptor subunit [Patescibacteria group bacterium]
MPQNILKSMSQHKMSTGVIIIAIAGLGYLAYNALPKGGNAVRYVTAIVEKGTLIVSVSGSGNVVAQDSADINPGISGTVAAIKVSLGDAVEKGQILAVIKNDDLDIKKESAFSALNIAKEAVKKAKLDRTQKYQ